LDSLTLHPHAKINLGLRVLGRRADGYHDLRTRFQTIDLTDDLILEKKPSGLRLKVEGAATGPENSNLALRAARALAEDRREAPGASLLLRKRIPPAAGLGGGSSDAAATLLGLNLLWDLGLDERELSRIAKGLGADAPFFLVGGSALGLGRGDTIVPLKDVSDFHVALVLPPFDSRTPEVFRLWDETLAARGGTSEGRPRFTEGSAADPASGPSAASVHNDLEELIVSRHPQLAEYLEVLRRHGARGAALSGSGPSVYGLFETREEVSALLRAPEWRGVRVVGCEPIGRAEYRRRLGIPLSD
jgi:4-diphosphocytidyl-2-C-methyl-D-erythritol kinase